MSLLNRQVKKKEEHKRQDLNNPDPNTDEGKALKHLKSLEDSLQLTELELKLALDQAVNNPKVALVDRLWTVTGFSWDGTEFKAETSEKETADECKDDFGWEVKEENGPFYKYSRSFGKPTGRGNLYKWVNQPEKIKPREVETGKSKRSKNEPEEIKRCLRTGTYTSGGTDLNNEAGVEWWKEFTIMKILWLNKNLRASFKDTSKTGKLDMNLLIDEERAKNLLSFLGFGDWGLPHEIRDWLERSAKPRAAEGA